MDHILHLTLPGTVLSTLLLFLLSAAGVISIGIVVWKTQRNRS